MGAIDQAFGRWRCWRRFRGGHWERWTLDEPMLAMRWLRLDECPLPGFGGLFWRCHQREDYDQGYPRSTTVKEG